MWVGEPDQSHVYPKYWEMLKRRCRKRWIGWWSTVGALPCHISSVTLSMPPSACNPLFPSQSSSQSSSSSSSSSLSSHLFHLPPPPGPSRALVEVEGIEGRLVIQLLLPWLTMDYTYLSPPFIHMMIWSSSYYNMMTIIWQHDHHHVMIWWPLRQVIQLFLH